MKFGIRTPSLKRRFAARTSWKRVVRHSMGLKAPRGMGVITNPKRALYNAVYSRTSVSVNRLVKRSSRRPPKRHPLDGKSMTVSQKEDGSIDCPGCGTNMGQPKEVGWLVKKKEYRCHSCGIKATIN